VRATAIASWAAAICLSIATIAMPLVAYSATATTVSIKDFAFQPSTVVIHVGDAISWTNLDGTTHTATDVGVFDTGNMTYDTTRTITFATPGTYLYYCVFHSIMFGAVVVIPADQPLPAVAPTIAPGELRGPLSSPLITVGTDLAPTLAPARDPGAPAADVLGPLSIASLAIFVLGVGALAWRLGRLRTIA
jgi:plastocyanin